MNAKAWTPEPLTHEQRQGLAPAASQPNTCPRCKRAADDFRPVDVVCDACGRYPEPNDGCTITADFE